MDKITADKILDKLSLIYNDKPSLNYKTPYQLLIAVVLSAQCTDERVNKVTDKLFEVAPTPDKMIALGRESLEKYIFSCGLYRSKAEHIISLSEDIINRFEGKVPETHAELCSLAGVGRKTANVVYAVAFGGDAIAVDTHVFRVASRIGFSTGAKTPLETEKRLMEKIDKKRWRAAHHYIIYLGRDKCKARLPDCKNCIIEDLCEKHL